MVEKGRKKGTARFALRPDGGVRRVLLAASFGGWQPTRMQKQKDGSFVSVLSVPPGTHEYKFIVDDQWVVDPDNSAWVPNTFGSMNSLVSVE